MSPERGNFTLLPNQKSMNVYVVIPYFSDGIEIKSNDIKVFNTREAAYQYTVKERFTHYDIIASEYVAF